MSMKGFCKVLATTMLVLGTIGSIFIAKTMGMSLNMRTYDMERNWGTTIIVFLFGFLSVVVLSVILYAIDEILGNQESLYKELSQALDNLRSPEKSSFKGVPSNNWECPKCGKINPNYTGTCGCGASKPQ